MIQLNSPVFAAAMIDGETILSQQPFDELEFIESNWIN